MAIDKLFRSVEVNNSQKSIKSDRYFLIAVVLSSLFLSSCSESKLTQCQQIFRIAAQVNNSSKNVSYTNEDSNIMKSWLEAAGTMNKAADNVQALHINDSKLIRYQNQLATIYRIYSQATYDAVAARESKNLEALEFARINAQKAGQMQQDLIQDLNKYCLNR